MDKISAIHAFILAGGKSSRFGSDKSLYPYRGKPLIAHAADMLGSLFTSVSIISNNADALRFLGLPVLPDLRPGLGPLGGIHTALYHAGTEAVFIVPCDMPDLHPGLIRRMTGALSGADIVVPRIDGRYEPLHALYRDSCLPAIESALDRGERRIVAFYAGLRIREFGREEIASILALNPNPHDLASPPRDINNLFININYRP